MSHYEGGIPKEFRPTNIIATIQDDDQTLIMSAARTLIRAQWDQATLGAMLRCARQCKTRHELVECLEQYVRFYYAPMVHSNIINFKRETAKHG